jgi:hypothetical protein
MTVETFNGYANRETYDAVLWLTNDQDTYTRCRTAALEAYADTYADTSGLILTGPELYRFAVREAGDAIRALVDDWADSVLEGFADRDTRLAILDIGSLWRIDWPEVAGAVLPEHSAYPHEPGYLSDCYGCEESCHCRPGCAECVYPGSHNGNAE